ncbi:S8 family serine peptidase [Ectopseudomonas guguanensis]|uniref:S8 family serine peptidase n=1 Tax=Ectopseudomonas guguanensis TaxID=1198456 RepID=UPI00285F28D6|nr:S8 family serine peptidase [Pseudomonas guguanensis]MDR8015149.1 S8 family serine peptidase [Pseudomonas guguanensis]
MQGFQRTTVLLLLLSAGWTSVQADEKPSFAAQAQIAVDDQQSPRYIIKYKELAPSPMSQANQPQPLSAGRFESRAAQRLLSQAQVQPLMHLDSQAASVAHLSPAQLKQLQANPAIDYIELDPRRYLMAEQVPYGIPMVQADLLPDNAISNMKVCIVDSGYDLGHQDLPSAGITGNDGYGSVNSGNWYEDGDGHGTHVAGTIAALGGNNLGVVGVSPSGNLGLHIVKVFNNSGSWAYGSDLVMAIQQCRAAGSTVISMSLGGGASSITERNAMDAAYQNGGLVVAAAGNSGNSTLSYPASYDSVVSVAAVDSSGNHASFSQYNNQVEVAAPGVGVRSTLPGNRYASYNGTSMATPHVSAVYALVWSQHRQCTPAQIRRVVNITAEDRGTPGRDPYYGYGIVKAKRASDLIAQRGCDVSDGGSGEEQTYPNLSGARGAWVRHSVAVPSGARRLTVRISGGSGDADLYTRLGSQPTTSQWTCRPYLEGNQETCIQENPAAGTWHIGVMGYSSFSGVTLYWRYE